MHLTFRWRLDDFRKHPIAILIGSDNLKFISRVGVQVMYLNISSIRRIDWKFDPVSKFGILFSIPRFRRTNMIPEKLLNKVIVYKTLRFFLYRLPNFIFLPTGSTSTVSGHPFNGNSKRSRVRYGHISWGMWSSSFY